MTQSTMTKPSTDTNSTYDPYAGSAFDDLSFNDTDSSSTAASSDATSSQDLEPVYKLNIDEAVIEKISSLAAQKIDGIIDMKGNFLSTIQEGLGGNDRKKGVDADVVDGQNAKVDLSIILEYGKSATDVFDQIKEVIGKDIKDMTGMNVIEMTVNVVDVMDQDEYNQKRGNNSDYGQGGDSSN